MELYRLLNEPTLSPPPSLPSPTRLTEIPTFLHSDHEIPDSQEQSQSDTLSWDSRDSPRPSSNIQVPQTPQKQYASPTTRSDRIRIKTALDFGHSVIEICAKYGYTQKQVYRAKDSRLTPQKHRRGRKPLFNTPKRQRLEQWLLESPSHRHLSYKQIPQHLPEIQAGPKAIRNAFKLIGYSRRIARRKGFSDDPEVKAERLAFAKEAITWTRERLNQQIFSDEV
jgi:transposase